MLHFCWKILCLYAYSVLVGDICTSEAMNIIQIALQQQITFHSFSSEPISFSFPLCVQRGAPLFQICVMTGNAKEKCCCCKQLGDAVWVTALPKIVHLSHTDVVLKPPFFWTICRKVFRLLSWLKHLLSTIIFGPLKYCMVGGTSLNRTVPFKFIHLKILNILLFDTVDICFKIITVCVCHRHETFT